MEWHLKWLLLSSILHKLKRELSGTNLRLEKNFADISTEWFSLHPGKTSSKYFPILSWYQKTLYLKEWYITTPKPCLWNLPFSPGGGKKSCVHMKLHVTGQNHNFSNKTFIRFRKHTGSQNWVACILKAILWELETTQFNLIHSLQCSCQ